MGRGLLTLPMPIPSSSSKQSYRRNHIFNHENFKFKCIVILILAKDGRYFPGPPVPGRGMPNHHSRGGPGAARMPRAEAELPPRFRRLREQQGIPTADEKQSRYYKETFMYYPLARV